MGKLPLTWRQVALCTLLIAAAALLLSAHDTVAQAVRDGLLLCGQSIIPSLFPLFVAVSLLIGCGLGNFFSPRTTALVLGLVGGYPMGAKAISALIDNGSLDQNSGQRLLLCCNNAGPAFILGIAGHSVFNSAAVGWALYAIHALSALILFALLPCKKMSPCSPQPPPSFARVFVSTVSTGVTTMANICGFVILFLVVLRLLTAYTGLCHPLLLGAIELTNGILSLPNTADGFVLAAALLGFGGFSVHCQTAAVLEGSGLHLFPYLSAKLAQAGISVVLAFAVRGWFFR